MEKLRQQEQIINLGRLFVKELKLETESDTLSQWMAHYIAEKITNAENLTGKEKQVAEKECFDVILKLWENRWILSPRNRPFKDFEPILTLLEAINPDNSNDHYHRVIVNGHYPELENNLPLNSNWIMISKEIDRVARIWIEYCISMVVADIDSKKTKEWIENAKDLPTIEDVNTINILINMRSKEVSEEDNLNKYELERIKRRINELEKFNKLNELILEAYKNELAQLQK